LKEEVIMNFFGAMLVVFGMFSASVEAAPALAPNGLINGIQFSSKLVDGVTLTDHVTAALFTIQSSLGKIPMNHLIKRIQGEVKPETPAFYLNVVIGRDEENKNFFQMMATCEVTAGRFRGKAMMGRYGIPYEQLKEGDHWELFASSCFEQVEATINTQVQKIEVRKHLKK
jgi:hypothetical protein